ncbi:MAG: hypothetical protein QOD83_4150 [Solirubrobacteraceae bacterium]|nr:hypothetical protein [Solirubrobacteraceae bacterium]
MSSAGARFARRTPRRSSTRAMVGFVALLSLSVMLCGWIAFGIGWSAELAAWLGPAVAFTGFGVAVARRVPENPFGWLLLSIGGASALTAGTWSDAVPGVLVWLRSWVMYTPAGLLPVALLLFPNGRLPSPSWRGPYALALAGAVIPAFFLAVASAVEPDPVGIFGSPGEAPVEKLLMAAKVGAGVAAFALLLAIVSLFVRLRRVTDVERRQILCLFLGAIALAIGLGLEIAGFTDALLAGWLALALAPGVAILWHRLYDLDLFLNRSLVHAGLSAALLAAFVATVTLLGSLAPGELPGGAWTLAAVAVAAVGLDPLRRRLQRAVDRVLFGHRDDPYRVMTALGGSVGAPADAPTLLCDVAEAVARGLALPYVAIEVASDHAAQPLAEWGRRHGEPIALALAHHGKLVGRLLVTPRTVGGNLPARDRSLLEDVARSVAVTVSAVELSAGLQRAREQLVTAREEERRRLRRDLHDGLGPTLASMVMQMDAASNVLRRDTGAVEPLLAGLRTTAQDAIAEVRRLVYELRPAALDEHGLAGAIREWIERISPGGGAGGLSLSLQAPPRLPALPAAVEVAALRIVQEAVTNVVRHSRARNCSVDIAADGALTIAIEDDGCGLSADRPAGVGLGSMRERAAELGGTCTITGAPGGGTHVHAILPLSVS